MGGGVFPIKKIKKWGGQLGVGRLNKEGGVHKGCVLTEGSGGVWVLGYTFMQGRFCCNIHSTDHAKQNHTNTGFIKRKKGVGGGGGGGGSKKRKERKTAKT